MPSLSFHCPIVRLYIFPIYWRFPDEGWAKHLFTKILSYFYVPLGEPQCLWCGRSFWLLLHLAPNMNSSHSSFLISPRFMAYLDSDSWTPERLRFLNIWAVLVMVPSHGVELYSIRSWLLPQLSGHYCISRTCRQVIIRIKGL